ncbi:PREDICTED: uncharacterized protein LOC108611844 [Drosophila arizonae]|uniref:Uncharacterized protein LOC108611844 n=1 Tax=Drosophila arizonae TaxID=7263 RepID=A0ABM1NYW6_DROAR|nr:PREDICTED: uncharacterized protein LOC108611844 [Drosophila arizonae]
MSKFRKSADRASSGPSRSSNPSAPAPTATPASEAPDEVASPSAQIAKTETPISLDVPSTKKRRLEYLRSGIDSDCEVHVAKNASSADDGASTCYRKFKCHRLFLATASEKLEHDIFENKSWNGVLQINGVSPQSVEIFLEFIYTFELATAQIDLLLIGDIFILSCAYNLPDLMLSFSQELKNITWPLAGILPAFNLAFRHNIYDLENFSITKIVENAAALKNEPGLKKLQIYAFNYVIQFWLATEALSTNEIIQIVQEYQKENNLIFKNTQQFPHFIKIINYFPSMLLDAEGFIVRSP